MKTHMVVYILKYIGKNIIFPPKILVLPFNQNIGCRTLTGQDIIKFPIKHNIELHMVVISVK